MDKAKKIIDILNSSKDDDLHRAKLAFMGYTEEQINEPFGYSGKSCREILDAYQAHENMINELIQWIKENGAKK